MAALVWNDLPDGSSEGTLGSSTVWFRVSPAGFSDYHSITTNLPLPVGQATTLHGSQAAKDASQSIVDQFTGLLTFLATP